MASCRWSRPVCGVQDRCACCYMRIGARPWRPCRWLRRAQRGTSLSSYAVRLPPGSVVVFKFLPTAYVQVLMSALSLEPVSFAIVAVRSFFQDVSHSLVRIEAWIWRATGLGTASGTAQWKSKSLWAAQVDTDPEADSRLVTTTVLGSFGALHTGTWPHNCIH